MTGIWKTNPSAPREYVGAYSLVDVLLSNGKMVKGETARSFYWAASKDYPDRAYVVAWRIHNAEKPEGVSEEEPTLSDSDSDSQIAKAHSSLKAVADALDLTNGDNSYGSFKAVADAIDAIGNNARRHSTTKDVGLVRPGEVTPEGARPLLQGEAVLPPAKVTPSRRFPKLGYERLHAVYRDAHDQAAYGKGNDRHANDLPFHEQRMQTISQGLNSPDGMAYQVIKKLQEGLQMEDASARRRELLGALNYLAGVVIFLDDREAGGDA